MNVSRSAATLVGQHYRLEGLLGEGGCGAVYAATDLRLQRPVAVKLLHAAALDQRDTRERFAREAQLARQLHHPHTLRLLDFGEDADGTPFIVYELLHGQTLKQALQVGPLAPRRVGHIARQLLASLSDAHQRGIVHRDIKPANLFLCDFSGENDYLKVLDFGIARLDGRHAARTAITETGMTIGTPSYMAPEQVRGQAVSPATDLYAVGLVMAEMLSGQKAVTGASAPLIVMAQASDDPVSLPPFVGQSPLGGVIARAIRKPLAERYATAPQMLAELEAIDPAVLASEPMTIGAAAMVTIPTRQAGTLTAATAATTAQSGAGPSATYTLGTMHSQTMTSEASRRWLPWALGAMAMLLLVIGGLAAAIAFDRPDKGARAEPDDAPPSATGSVSLPTTLPPTSPPSVSRSKRPTGSTTRIAARHPPFTGSLLNDASTVPGIVAIYREAGEQVHVLIVSRAAVYIELDDPARSSARGVRVESTEVLVKKLDPERAGRPDAVAVERAPFDQLPNAVAQVRAHTAHLRGRVLGVNFVARDNGMRVGVETPTGLPTVDFDSSGSASMGSMLREAPEAPPEAAQVVGGSASLAELRHAHIVARLASVGWVVGADSVAGDAQATSVYGLTKGLSGTGSLQLSRFSSPSSARTQAALLASGYPAVRREGATVLAVRLDIFAGDPTGVSRDLLDVVRGAVTADALFPRRSVAPPGSLPVLPGAKIEITE